MPRSITSRLPTPVGMDTGATAAAAIVLVSRCAGEVQAAAMAQGKTATFEEWDASNMPMRLAFQGVNGKTICGSHW